MGSSWRKFWRRTDWGGTPEFHMPASKKLDAQRNSPRKNLRRNKPHLDALIAEAIVDAYNESEQTVGFYTIMEHSLALPFVTEILGIKVAVEQIDMNEDDAIVAV